MWRKVILTIAIFCLFWSSSAFAVETAGEVVFRDALYGGAIGGIIAGAVYLTDQKEFAKKIGTGVAIGTIAGLLYGLYENTAFAEIQDGRVKFAMPSPQIINTQDGKVIYSANALRVRF